MARRPLAALALASLLVAAGCGSSSDSSSDSSATTSPGATPAPSLTVVPAATSAGGTPAATEAAAGAATPTGTVDTSVPTYQGDKNSEFCQQATSMAQNVRMTGDEDPPTLKKLVQDAIDRLPALQAVAPSELKADLATIARTFKNLTPILEANGYDLGKILTDAQAAADFNAVADQATGAEARYGAYTESVCGIPPDGVAGPPEPAGSSPTGNTTDTAPPQS